MNKTATVSFGVKDAVLLAFVEDVAGVEELPDGTKNLTGNGIRACLYDYMELCRVIERGNLDVLIDNIDHVKADKSARGHTWVLLANDTKKEQP